MIKNERQYRITKSQAVKFEQALKEFRTQSKEKDQLHPLLRQAQMDALQSQLDDLRSELEGYEEERDKLEVPAIESIAMLPRTLIEARAASGLTQKELAMHLGLKEQQIQRYEATEYASASFSRINEIAECISQALRVKKQRATSQKVRTRRLKKQDSVPVS